MPRATVNANDTERYDLKTCEGGFVVLRRLTYGEKLKRQEMSFGAAMKVDGGRKRQQSAEMVMDMAQTAATEFEFKNCIVEHNLEDDSGALLDFRTNTAHIHLLDPRIGEEISEYINQMNNAPVDLGN